MYKSIPGYDAVAEVRKIREQMYEKYGDDWNALSKVLKAAGKRYYDEMKMRQNNSY